jgi:hypothetical protein
LNRWFEKFRDDAGEPGWLDRFRDDPVVQTAADVPPRSMLMFVYLLAASLALGLFTVAATYSAQAQLLSLPEIVLPEVLTIALFSVFIWLAAFRRKQWALWTLLIFCTARLLFFMPSFLYVKLWIQIITAVYFTLQATAFWFAFKPGSRRWFLKKIRTGSTS